MPVDVERDSTIGAVRANEAGVQATRFADGTCAVVAHGVGLHLLRPEAEALGRMLSRLYFLGDDNK